MIDMLSQHKNKILSSIKQGERIGKLELVIRHNPNDDKVTRMIATKTIKEYVIAAEDLFMWGEPQCSMLLVNNKTYVLSNIKVKNGMDSALFLAYPESIAED